MFMKVMIGAGSFMRVRVCLCIRRVYFIDPHHLQGGAKWGGGFL